MLFIEGAFTKFQLYKKRKTEHFIFFFDLLLIYGELKMMNLMRFPARERNLHRISILC